MKSFQKVSIFLLRISMGWLFFYAGITKVLNPEWSAEGYLKGAVAFQDLFNWLASPGVLPVINILNEWGLTLIGISLILGIWVRYSAVLGALLMVLYYLPLGFPHPNAHSYIVDEHVIYLLSLMVLGTTRSGRVWGLDSLSKD